VREPQLLLLDEPCAALEVLVLRDSEISLDRPVLISRPRRVGGEDFDELRDPLLAELGVLAGQRREAVRVATKRAGAACG
jgi:hypothetical protein